MRATFILLLILLLTACDSSADPTPQPTEIAIIYPLATVGPTATLNQAEIFATQTAQPPTPTTVSNISTPTPTPYVGVFLGEAAVDPLAGSRNVGPSDVLVLPTSSQPGAIPLICAYDQDPEFGTAWQQRFNLREEMSCAIQQVSTFEGVVQFFERGVMYYNPFTNEVWAIAPGEPGEPGEFWSTGQVQEVTPSIAAPEGLRVPEGAFGAIWATIPQVRDALGFATTTDQPNDLKTQRFVGGTLLLDVTAGQVFVLAVDGDAYGPF